MVITSIEPSEDTINTNITTAITEHVSSSQTSKSLTKGEKGGVSLTGRTLFLLSTESGIRRALELVEKWLLTDTPRVPIVLASGISGSDVACVVQVCVWYRCV